MEKFLIVKDSIKTIRRFSVKGRVMEFKVRSPPEKCEPLVWMKEAINQIVQEGIKDLEPQDKVGLSFCSKDFHKGEGWMKFKPVSEVSTEDIWNTISSIIQSNASMLHTDTFCLRVTSVNMPAGKGRANKYNSFDEECSKRRGIVVIKNTDNTCLARAIVVAKAYIDKDIQYIKVRNNVAKLQEQRALKLINDTGINIPETGAGIPEIQLFEKYLEEYKITVYQYGNKGRDVIYEGLKDKEKKLNLLYHDNHYNVITSLTSAFCCSFYCEQCHTPYNTKEKHQCGGRCYLCQKSPPCSKDAITVSCDKCQRDFKGQSCFENHLKQRLCEKIHRCGSCWKTIFTEREHICGNMYCKTCKSYTTTNHTCFMPVDNGSPKLNGLLFIFYDLETQIQDNISLHHEPTLCVLNQRCYQCINEKHLYFCQTCGFRQKVFKNNVISDLVNHILLARKVFKKIIVIAHNGGGDHQFILNYVIKNTDVTPDLVMNGTKLISMSLNNVKFIDSLNYFPMSLSKLPEAFGLKGVKGYFPHNFSKKENQKYIGPIPDIKFYDPDSLKPKERDLLTKWHSEQSNNGYIFDFEKEILEYCISDVNILTETCLIFRQLMIDQGNTCPFSEAVTLPSACNKIYRRNFLKPETIGVIPKKGYRFSENQSKIAVQYLLWEEKQRQINIQHAAKGKEAVVAGLRVDGYCDETNQIFEFYGCFWHGCKCLKFNRDISLHKITDARDTPNSLYEATLARADRLRKLGYEVLEMWECDFRKMMKDNKEIGLYTEQHPLFSHLPLNPRDAFYGGRTGNTKTYYTCGEGEYIKYMDICSLYPYINRYGKYPVGHPKVFVGEECYKLNINEISGLIKCKILPPQHLFHPVLPVKMNKKLMFVLCRTCGEQFNNNECFHIANDRALTGTWVMEEVSKAIEKGYRVLEIFEIWQYQTDQYNPETKTGGLFSDYISHFLKLRHKLQDGLLIVILWIKKKLIYENIIFVKVSL